MSAAQNPRHELMRGWSSVHSLKYHLLSPGTPVLVSAKLPLTHSKLLRNGWGWKGAIEPRYALRPTERGSDGKEYALPPPADFRVKIITEWFHLGWRREDGWGGAFLFSSQKLGCTAWVKVEMSPIFSGSGPPNNSGWEEIRYTSRF